MGPSSEICDDEGAGKLGAAESQVEHAWHLAVRLVTCTLARAVYFVPPPRIKRFSNAMRLIRFSIPFLSRSGFAQIICANRNGLNTKYQATSRVAVRICLLDNRESALQHPWSSPPEAQIISYWWVYMTQTADRVPPSVRQYQVGSQPQSPKPSHENITDSPSHTPNV